MTINAADEFYDPELDPGRIRARWRWLIFATPKTLGKWIAEESQFLALWVPVAIGTGVGAYFGLKTEPDWVLGVLALLAAMLCWFLGAGWGRKASVVGGLVVLGFVTADLRTFNVSAPVIDRELSIRTVSGRLLSIEDRPGGIRVLLDVQSIEKFSQDQLPARVRISWRGSAFNAQPGEIISLRAGLRPPPAPAAPGAFDYARQLYFQRIGAVGFAVSLPEILEPAPTTLRMSLLMRIETLRSNLFHRIIAVAPGEGGAIVAAIVTGKRDAITDRSKAALRDTGLAHLLAISGLHMGLATGLIFFAVRFLLAAIEPIALKYPIKKWAAAAALLSGVGYLILSGGGWSARRAFIMAAIMFVAILVDRRALSLRNVAIAATIILLSTPEALFHPGFQMSFAAVTALIAAYEWMSMRGDPSRNFSARARLRRYAIALGVTDTIAALATAPFALYHFNRVAVYSLPANLLSMPMMGFWIMPSAVVALLLTPFGLDGWAWRLSATGMEAILIVALEVGSWPGAVSLTAQWPMIAVLMLSLGGLVVCLVHSPLRFLGLLGLPAAIVTISSVQTPQIFVAASGLNASVVATSKPRSMAVYSRRRDRFSMSVWAEYIGLEAEELKPVMMEDRGDCDRSGCVMEIAGGIVASFIEDTSMLAEDCTRADIVVAFFPVSGKDWRSCEAILIDRRSVWRRGAHALWIEPGGSINIKTVAAVRGQRPWTKSLN